MPTPEAIDPRKVFVSWVPDDQDVSSNWVQRFKKKAAVVRDRKKRRLQLSGVDLARASDVVSIDLAADASDIVVVFSDDYLVQSGEDTPEEQRTALSRAIARRKLTASGLAMWSAPVNTIAFEDVCIGDDCLGELPWWRRMIEGVFSPDPLVHEPQIAAAVTRLIEHDPYA